MQDPEFEPPVNPLPPVVVAFFVVIVGIEAVLALGNAGLVGGPEAVGWRLTLIQDYGFSGQIFDLMVQNRIWPLQEVMRVVTYPFINLGFFEGLFAVVLLLALGKMVAERMGQLAFVLIFVLSGIGGAITYALLLDDPVWLVGAFPSAYGLIGGYSFVMWRVLGAQGGPQHRAFSLIAMLMGIQLLWGVFFNTGNTWVADLAGFVFGFGLSFLLAPGEWRKIRDQIRRR